MKTYENVLNCYRLMPTVRALRTWRKQATKDIYDRRVNLAICLQSSVFQCCYASLRPIRLHF